MKTRVVRRVVKLDAERRQVNMTATYTRLYLDASHVGTDDGLAI
jgi:hypothetical protein